jgi:hypothetical protein
MAHSERCLNSSSELKLLDVVEPEGEALVRIAKYFAGHRAAIEVACPALNDA